MVRQQANFKKNPIGNANIFSRLCYWWLMGIWYKGTCQDLEMKDLYEPVHSERSEVLGDQLEREWKKELTRRNTYHDTNQKRSSHYKPSLLRCILRIHFWSYMFQGLLTFLESVVCTNLQTIFLGRLIMYFDPGSTMTKTEVYCYATGIAISATVAALAGGQAHFAFTRLGMKIRVACSTLVYRKVLKLSKAALDQTSGGQIVNLLSNDVHRFDFFALHLHYFWITPIQIILISYLIWQEVGIATLAGVAIILLQKIPEQGYIIKLSVQLRRKIAQLTDKRVQLMSELISGIQVVKMYSWEKSFERIINGIRAMEMKLVFLACYCRSFHLNGVVFNDRVTVFVTLITVLLTGNDVNARMAFTILAYWKTLQTIIAAYIPVAAVSAGDAYIAIRRIQEYLLLEDVKPDHKDSVAELNRSNYRSGVTIVKLSANWTYGALPPTLCNLSLTVEKGQLCALVGSVGSGKSSVLQLILGELSAANGSLDIGGKTISYAAQEAWLFGGTIRDNILFGLPYVKEKYDEVTEVCALNKDLQQLPNGHMTLVGDRGVTLSGGQRARINLARAVYRNADIYLLDDPLSAVDTRVGRQLFQKCIKGYLREKTRILVTHQLQYLENVDTIALLKDGHLESQGTFESLMSSSADFAHLINSYHSAQEQPKATLKCFLPRTQSQHSIVFISESVDGEPETLHEEEIAKGQISFEVYKRYFKAGGSICLRVSVLLIAILAQVATSGVDYWVTFWTNQEGLKQSVNYPNFPSNFSRSDIEIVGRLDSNASVVSKDREQHSFYTTNTNIAIYSGIISCCIVFTLVRSALVIRLCVNSSKTLHSEMFANISQATMRFFNKNPSGRILNRFSKDIGVMDEMLPRSMVEVITVLCIVLGSFSLIIVSSYYMIIAVIILGGVCNALRNCYLPIAQCITRLESVGKSPVLSHVNYSLDGLITIRSSVAQRRMIKEFDDLQNLHTSASFVNIATSNAFSFYINFLVAVLITVVCFIFIILDDEETMSGHVGLAISQSIALTQLIQFGLKKSVQIISEMTSTERVLQYTKLPKEGPFDSNASSKPPSTWPQFGAIAIENLSLKYNEEKPAVLKNININISHGQKIGIVGRTGAGKSSLITALFRLAKTEGSLKIDNIDVQTIGLHDLRSKISIIPQEPTLFRATLRQNLDPFQEFSDDCLWSVLDEVQLKASFTSLDYEINEGGANLSLGERQLLCLARAILKNNKIVILDEATANVDSRTDGLIQETIRRKFADRTVLTIAHRLSTIMDNDRVVVLDAGRVVEFDHPRNLLENSNGYFTRMVNGTVPIMAEQQKLLS